jgi:hypothetical protein
MATDFQPIIAVGDKSSPLPGFGYPIPDGNLAVGNRASVRELSSERVNAKVPNITQDAHNLH